MNTVADAPSVALRTRAPTDSSVHPLRRPSRPPMTVEAPAPARAVTKREAATNIARRAKRRSIAAARQPRLQRPTFGSGSVGKDPTAYSVSDSGIGTKTDTPILVTPASVQVVP